MVSVKFDSTLLLEPVNNAHLSFLHVMPSFSLGCGKRLVVGDNIFGLVSSREGWQRDDTGCQPCPGRENQFSLELSKAGDATSFWEDYQDLRQHKQFLLNLQTRHSNSLKVQN